MFICIDNKSKRSELEIGKRYELFKHEQHPKIVWCKIPDETIPIGYRTIQCYFSDFQSKGEFRNELIDKILN